MAEVDRFDILVLGSGESGKYLAWTMAAAGQLTAVVERKLIGGGSCPNVACLPSKNIVHSAQVRPLAARAPTFGNRSDRDGHEGCNIANIRWLKTSSESIASGTKPPAWN